MRAVQKEFLADLLQNRSQACNFIKKRLQHRCFPMKFIKFFRALFLQNISTLVAASGSKQCKPMKTYTTKLMLPRKKWYTWTVILRLVFLDKEYSSKVFQTLLAMPNFSKLAVAEVCCKKVVLENFANHRCFSVNFVRFSRTPFS